MPIFHAPSGTTSDCYGIRLLILVQIPSISASCYESANDHVSGITYARSSHGTGRTKPSKPCSGLANSHDPACIAVQTAADRGLEHRQAIRRDHSPSSGGNLWHTRWRIHRMAPPSGSACRPAYLQGGYGHLHRECPASGQDIGCCRVSA